MIEVENVVKRYGSTTALAGLSFSARPGTVTGFLGPNGAGKSTALRVLLGLDRPDRGRAVIAGRRYGDLRAPLRLVGSLLDAKGVPPRVTARSYLLAAARTNGIPVARVGEVLALCGLESVARRRVGGFSLGMSQRLGLAAALLGDPAVLVLDEPVNGLDPDGIIWLRELLRDVASRGRTVLLSSHLMSEMAQTADDIVLIARGRLLRQTTVSEIVATAAGGSVLVRAERLESLARVLSDRRIQTDWADGGASSSAPAATAGDRPGRFLRVTGCTTDEIGRLAFEHGFMILELRETEVSLEDAYLQLTRDDTQYSGRTERGERTATEVPA